MLRKWLYALITIVLSTTFALIIGELFLVVYSSGNAVTDDMDSGLIRYHRRYGWNLTPNWQGSHNHTDYAVQYSIDAFGFREHKNRATSSPPDNSVSKKGQSAVSPTTRLIVGDSFTFGLGVANAETFVALLDERPDLSRIYNGAVPGYSPEQILLRAQDLTRMLNPEHIVFVVYLGNDLIDLGLEFPVQAEFPKPMARIGAAGWEIAGIPVPRKQKPAAARQRTLGSFVVEAGSESWISKTQTGRRLISQGLIADPARLNESSVQKSLTLFEGVLEELNKLTTTQLTVMLLPGAVAMKEPNSLTGRYQRRLEQEIMQMTADRNMETISLIPILASNPKLSELYFPNDGHFTPPGHEAIARHLTATLMK